tara:strand:+ start:681 stop:839 length:159 start_codon:yes stop_codon:yes gene_type:complete
MEVTPLEKFTTILKGRFENKKWLAELEALVDKEGEQIEKEIRAKVTRDTENI